MKFLEAIERDGKIHIKADINGSVWQASIWPSYDKFLEIEEEAYNLEEASVDFKNAEEEKLAKFEEREPAYLAHSSFNPPSKEQYWSDVKTNAITLIKQSNAPNTAVPLPFAKENIV